MSHENSNNSWKGSHNSGITAGNQQYWKGGNLVSESTTEKRPERFPITVRDDIKPETRRMLDRITEILTYRRNRGSYGELLMIQRMIIKPYAANCDSFGNLYIRVGETEEEKNLVLWSCHTDTMHNERYDKKGMHLQKLEVFLDDRNKICMGLHKDDMIAGNCLGADDGAGIFVMLEMIDNKVPGTYVFHREEERGCLGSRHIRNKRSKNFLPLFKFAIAFDRKGDEDVVIRQSPGMCASREFAESFADQLKKINPDLNYKTSYNGTRTDTALYRDIVPECANIAVGYKDQHGPKETLDLEHLFCIAKAMSKFDPKQLVCKRDPKKDDYSYGQNNYRPWKNNNTYNKKAEEFYDGYYGNDEYWNKGKTEDKKSTAEKNDNNVVPMKSEQHTLQEYAKKEKEMEELVANFPEIATILLLQTGVVKEDFIEVYQDVYGKLPLDVILN